jgi:hypothetical protein
MVTLGTGLQAPPFTMDVPTCAYPGQPFPPRVSTHVFGGNETGAPQGLELQTASMKSDMLTGPQVIVLGGPQAQPHCAGGALRLPNPSYRSVG